MADTKTPKRSCDISQLAKRILDISTGEVSDSRAVGFTWEVAGRPVLRI